MKDSQLALQEGCGALDSRKPYEPPAIEETSQFETLALSCGQNVGNPAESCAGDPYNPGSSNYKDS
jgi:hypothetical protein